MIDSRPTDEQQEQAILAQHDLCETINRLGREGIDPRVILAGLGAATADLITCNFGPDAVAPWFLQHGELITQMMGRSH